jgi:hypothetical protein
MGDAAIGRSGDTATRRWGVGARGRRFVFSGEAEIQDSLGRSPRNWLQTREQR